MIDLFALVVTSYVILFPIVVIFNLPEGVIYVSLETPPLLLEESSLIASD